MPIKGAPFSTDRFWSRVEKSDGCWNWLAATTRKGYGQVSVQGVHKRAHRVAYELLVGPIPEGLTLDHTCRNPRCVNPAHLEPVTSRENVLRGEGISARNARKTRCKRGHPLSGENLYTTPSGQRRCQECAKARQRKDYASRQGEK